MVTELHDGLSLKGRLLILEHDLDWLIVGMEVVNNLIVTSGRNLARDRMFMDQPKGPLTHFAAGTDNATPIVSQTALLDEKVRGLLTSITPSTGQMVMRFFMSSTVGNGFTYREAGLFNLAAGGDMYCRATFADKSKTIAKTFTFIWTFSFGA